MTIDPNNLSGTATLTFDDEFNSLSLWNGSTGTWRTTLNINGQNYQSFPSNGELQWYIDNLNPNTTSVRPWNVSNGILTITASPADASIEPSINNYNYTSGLLTTENSFSQTYGYFEMRAKLPAGQGFWPAFWMLPTTTSARPEIDIMEVLGKDTTSLWQFSHPADASFDRPFNNTVPDMSAGFHTYGVDWEPDKTTFYFDGQVMGVAPTAPDMNGPMFLTLNLAVGGTWGGPPDATTPWPGNLQIDYVRAYEPLGASASPPPPPPPPPSGMVLTATMPSETLQGGSGTDTITAMSGSNYLRGGDGNDSIQGGSGFDDINGNKGDDTIDGGSGGGDWLVGGQGNDLISAHAGQNILYGNLGNDTLHAGSGGELMRGGQGDDSITGGIGNDWISGDRGSDTMSGGAGADVFHSFSGAGLDVVLDFNAMQGDRVQLDPGTGYTASQMGADTVVDMGGGDELILKNVQLSSLPQGWIFTL